MGMALDESIDGLDKLESNGIDAYIESNLYKHISNRGDIYIDYGTDRFGSTGYFIAVKQSPEESGCGDCTCS